MDPKLILALLIFELVPAYGVWHTFWVQPHSLLTRRVWVRGGKAVYLALSLPLLVALSILGGSEVWWLHVATGIVYGVALVSCRYRAKVWYAAAWRRTDDWRPHHVIAVIRMFARLGWQIDIEKLKRPLHDKVNANSSFRLVLTKGYRRVLLERALGKGNLHVLFWLVCRQPPGTDAINSDAPDPAEYLLVVKRTPDGQIGVEKVERA